MDRRRGGAPIAQRQKAALKRRHAKAVKWHAAKVEAEQGVRCRTRWLPPDGRSRPSMPCWTAPSPAPATPAPISCCSRKPDEVGPPTAYAQTVPDRHGPAADRGGPARLRPAERDDVAGRMTIATTVIGIDPPYVPEQ